MLYFGASHLVKKTRFLHRFLVICGMGGGGGGGWLLQGKAMFCTPLWKTMASKLSAFNPRSVIDPKSVMGPKTAQNYQLATTSPH